MSLTMICNARLPSEKAHPWQVVQMWKAFNQLESGSRLLFPFRFQRSGPQKGFGRQFWKYYGIQEMGPSSRLANIDAVYVLDAFPGLVKAYSRLQQLTFAVAATLWFLPKARRETRIWSREILVLPALRDFYPNLPLFYEMHRFPGSQVEKQLDWLRACNGIVCLTQLMKDKLLAHGFADETILVEGDGWSEELYGALPDKTEALKNLGLTSERKKVVYTGHLYKWKGVQTLVSAMKDLDDVECHIVGGLAEDRAALVADNLNWPKNVFLHRHVAPQKIPEWMAVADLAVVPNSGDTLLSREYTSPLKLFEILGAGIPLLASDLPSLREVISEDNASFAQADDVEGWIRAIGDALSNAEQSKEKALRGRELAKNHTWLKRAERVSKFMKDLGS